MTLPDCSVCYYPVSVLPMVRERSDNISVISNVVVHVYGEIIVSYTMLHSSQHHSLSIELSCQLLVEPNVASHEHIVTDKVKCFPIQITHLSMLMLSITQIVFTCHLIQDLCLFVTIVLACQSPYKTSTIPHILSKCALYVFNSKESKYTGTSKHRVDISLSD